VYGSSEIYTLLNVSAITTLLDSYVIGETSYAALFYDVLLPADFTGFKSINFYRTAAYAAAGEVQQFLYTINCRARTHAESVQIAYAVIAEINRVSFSSGFSICSLLPTLGPQDDTDVYNTPVEITLKLRS
jgi:hypothetical protein